MQRVQVLAAQQLDRPHADAQALVDALAVDGVGLAVPLADAASAVTSPPWQSSTVPPLSKVIARMSRHAAVGQP